MAQYLMVFSPTGGTRRVADLLAEGMGGQWQVVNLLRPVEAAALTAEDRCLVCVPSYGGRVPAVAVERLKAFAGNGAKAVLVCVYGNREWEDTLTELQDTMEAAGFVCPAAVAAVAEHSIFRQYAAGRPDNDDARQLADFARRICEKLQSGSTDAPALAGAHGTYKEFHGSALKPEANHNCVSCGLCARECPVDAIDPADPGKTDAAKCISCMRCVMACRQHARDLNKIILADIAARLEKALGGHKENHLFL